MSVISLLSSDTPNTDSPANVDAAVRNTFCNSLLSEILTSSDILQKEIRTDPRGPCNLSAVTDNNTDRFYRVPQEGPPTC